MKKRLQALLFSSCLIFPLLAGAGSRDLLFHQGIVFDTLGSPVNATLNVTLRLYESSSASSPFWEEAQAVTFDNGVFTAELGNAVAFPEDLFDHDSLFLGVQIEGDSEMTPRLGLFSVPWAQQAEVAVTAQSLANDVVTSVSIAPGAIESSDIAAGAIGTTELASTGVTPGTYTLATIVVDADGRISSATSGGAIDISASNITSGTLFDSRLSSNVSLLGSAIDLGTTEVSGTLPVTGGGTGADLSASGGANQFVKQISAGGPFSVGTMTDADVPDTITVNLATSATVLAANGTNCAADQYAMGVDPSGNAEGCTAVPTAGASAVNIDFFDSNPASENSNTTDDCINFNNTGTSAGRLGRSRIVSMDDFSTIRLIARAALTGSQGQPTLQIRNVTDGTTLVSISSGWTTTCATQTTTASIALSGQKKLECQEFSGVATDDPQYSHCAIELIP